ncbi:MAG: tRNA pseudouridine(13) synthase TruD [Planctomycetes bacterium]|nr:tRNA pseudouridine(13) synthase TruD [Planctomycetota bacterium]
MTWKPVVDEQWPCLTADLPGIGGAIKRHDEDFVVEELSLYEASGQGTHTYFTIEKHGLTTLAAVRHIAHALGRQSRDIGYAGLKDAHGITRQTFSVEHVDPSRVEALELSRIRILSVSRHTNKLKLGHLAGNRFAITIRDTFASPLEQAGLIIEALAKRGVPNYFGPQRFGVRGDNAQVGRAVLVGDYGEALALMLGRPASIDHGAMRTARELFDAGDTEAAARTWPREFAQQARICRALIKAGGDARTAWRAVDHTLRKLYVSAVQSELFNLVLARRIGTLDQLQDGDIAWKHRNGACFCVEDATVEQPRCATFEISPSGPLFGKKMMEPQGQPGQIEAEVLGASGLTREQVHTQDGTKLDGARRPLRVPLLEPGVDVGTDQNGAYLRLSFALPPGAYATTVTREVCKTSTA